MPVAQGDLLVVSVDDTLGRQYLFASFHGDTNGLATFSHLPRHLLTPSHPFSGDTNGLATIPMLNAVDALAKRNPEKRLIFGLDANTYERGSASKQDVLKFADEYLLKGCSSCGEIYNV